MTKKIISLLIFALLSLLLIISVSASDTDESILLYDGADLLTDKEEEGLLSKLTEISEKFELDVAVATVESTEGLSVTDFTEDYFDSCGLGQGKDCNGVLLLVDMGERDFRILSNGEDLGAAAISPEVIDNITSEITSDLSYGNYASAFNTYADMCEYQINGFINGFPFPYVQNIIIALVIGFIIAFIVVGYMKNQLKSVKKQHSARRYIKKGSLNITKSRDVFLYSTIRRIPRETARSSGRSSSSRNIGGGKF